MTRCWTGFATQKYEHDNHIPNNHSCGSSNNSKNLKLLYGGAATSFQLPTTTTSISRSRPNSSSVHQHSNNSSSLVAKELDQESSNNGTEATAYDSGSSWTSQSNTSEQSTFTSTSTSTSTSSGAPSLERERKSSGHRGHPSSSSNSSRKNHRYPVDHSDNNNNNNNNNNNRSSNEAGSLIVVSFAANKSNEYNSPELLLEDWYKNCGDIDIDDDENNDNINNNIKMGFGDDSADFSRALDEAFSSGPSRNAPPRTKSGSRHRPRTRSPPAGDHSVDSQGSSGGEGERERGGSGRGPAPGRGVARQRSQRRASIAAAVSLMATGGVTSDNHHNSRGGFDATTVEDHVNAARAERRIPRRAKHEDRLQAASMAGPMGAGYDQNVNNDRYTDDYDYDGHGSDRRGHERHGSGGGIGSRSHRHHHAGSSQDLGYDDEYYDNDVEEYDVPENHQHPTSRTERLRAGRRPRRAASDEDPYTHHHSEEADRRSRFAGKGPNRSFDEAASNVRSRGRRRASMMGGPAGAGAGANVEEDLNPVAAGLRARRARRASMVSGEGPGGAAPLRGEPAARGVRESRSAARMRRATMSTSTAGVDVQDFPGVAGSVGGYSAADNDFMMDQSQQDDTVYSAEKQEWAEIRADKQRAMLERLRKSKEEEQDAGSGGEEDQPEEEPEPAPEPEATKTPTARPRRRASLGILGMSTTSFSIVDDDGAKERKREEKARQKAEKAEKKRPGRSKSTDGGIPVPAVASRARATDRDRRRPGTMLDRIGA